MVSENSSSRFLFYRVGVTVPVLIKNATFLSLFVFGFTLMGAGAFNSPRTFGVPSLQQAIATGDLNRDGIPDLVLGGEPLPADVGRVRVFLGRGNGNFQFSADYIVGNHPAAFPIAPFVRRIRIADLNADGNLDVVAAHNSSSSSNSSKLLATILLGNGNGTLQSSDAFGIVDSDNDFVLDMEIADYTGDGLPDVVIASRTIALGSIVTIKNLGGGNFMRGGRRITEMPWAMRTADINTDGKADVVINTWRGTRIHYAGDDYFGTIENLGDEYDVRGLAVANLNSDAKPDIIAEESGTSNWRVYVSNRGRYPFAPAIYPGQPNSGYLRSVDLNQDGHSDIVAIAAQTGNFLIRYGDGSGSLSSLETNVNNIPVSDISFTDLDSNGRLDIAGSMYNGSGPNQAAVFLNAPNPSRYYTDFDGDTKSDLTVFRPTTSTWWTRTTDDSSFRAVHFGLPGDKLVNGNYDGDAKADIAVYREGIWYVLRSLDGTVGIDHWGLGSDVPVPADYDNDGVMNFAVFRPAEGDWYIKNSGGFTLVHWGLPSDRAVPGDYDGDGLCDAAIFRPSEGNWYIRYSRDGSFSVARFGLESDKPVRGDFDGDGKNDIAVFRPENGIWYILRSDSGNILQQQFGLSTDIPATNDFDGDNKTDMAVFRPSDGIWHIQNSSSSYVAVPWGLPGDKPASSNF